MKELTIDLKNYIENGTVFKRTAVRGIIERDGKYLIIHSKYGDYKFPGGGAKSTESLVDTLLREVREETGYAVVPDSIEEYMKVNEKRKGDPDDLLDMDSYYFFCKVEDEAGDRDLDDYEEEYDYQVAWMTLGDIIAKNESVVDYENVPWVVRETMVMKELLSDRVENKIHLEIGDITKLDCECIVNAANQTLLGGGGVDGAIHRAAGPELLEECRTLHGCQTGEAKITKGYRLKAKYVIHTVGPIYSGAPTDETDLYNCYYRSLELAKEYDIHSIAFPAISTGVYRYPLREAVPVALGAISNWLRENSDYGMTVTMSCFDQRTYDCYREYIGLQ